MPVLRDFFASYQWLRELRRGGQRTLVAVHFRVSDAEPVFVGHYGQAKLRLGAGEAIGALMRLADPRGYELIVPRSIRPDELHSVRAVRQVIGWRFHPGAKGTRPCGCEFCQRGQINSRRLRAPPPPERAKAAIIAELRKAASPLERVLLLHELGSRTRGNASELRWLLDDVPEVLLELASTLRSYRGPDAKTILRELCALPGHADELEEEDLSRVRREAAGVLSMRLGKATRTFLGELAERPEIAEALRDSEQD